MKTHKIESIITGHEGTVSCMEWNHLDSNFLASGTAEKQLYIWNLSQENIAVHIALKEYAIMMQWSQVDKNKLLILTMGGKFLD